MYRTNKVVLWKMDVGVVKGCIGFQHLWWVCVQVVAAQLVILAVSSAVVLEKGNSTHFPKV